MKIASAIFCGLLTLALTFRLMFKTNDDFFEAIRHWFTPDIISAFRGEWTEDNWNELKLAFWIGTGALGAYGGYQLFSE